MPDFERPIRDMRLHLAKTEQERAIIAAYHRGQDHARREMAIVTLIAAILTPSSARAAANDARTRN